MLELLPFLCDTLESIFRSLDLEVSTKQTVRTDTGDYFTPSMCHVLRFLVMPEERADRKYIISMVVEA